MSEDRATEWDKRYRDAERSAGAEPAEFLREVLHLLPPGRALDLAMGGGRNAIFLAAHGWRVTGIDWSLAALDKAEALARNRGFPVVRADSPVGDARDVTGLALVKSDLQSCELPAGRFNVVLCFNYLQRSLFPAIESALCPGGALVYQTYTLNQLNFSEGPRNPDYLLRSGELREAFSRLNTVIYRETSEGRAVASMLAIKPGH